MWYHAIAIKIPDASRRHIRVYNLVTHKRFPPHLLVLLFKCAQFILDGAPVSAVPERAKTPVCGAKVVIAGDTGFENGE